MPNRIIQSDVDFDRGSPRLLPGCKEPEQFAGRRRFNRATSVLYFSLPGSRRPGESRVYYIFVARSFHDVRTMNGILKFCILRDPINATKKTEKKNNEGKIDLKKPPPRSKLFETGRPAATRMEYPPAPPHAGASTLQPSGRAPLKAHGQWAAQSARGL